jgi:hypothetical protein
VAGAFAWPDRVLEQGPLSLAVLPWQPNGRASFHGVITGVMQCTNYQANFRTSTT